MTREEKLSDNNIAIAHSGEPFVDGDFTSTPPTPEVQSLRDKVKNLEYEVELRNRLISGLNKNISILEEDNIYLRNLCDKLREENRASLEREREVMRELYKVHRVFM